MSVASEEDNRSPAILAVRASTHTYLYALLISDHFGIQLLHFFPLEVPVRRDHSRPFVHLFHGLFNIFQQIQQLPDKNLKTRFKKFMNLWNIFVRLVTRTRVITIQCYFSCLSFFDAVSAKLSWLPQSKISSRFHPSNLIFAFLQVRALPVISKPSN